MTFVARRPVSDAAKAQWKADRSWLIFESKGSVMAGRLTEDAKVNTAVSYVQVPGHEKDRTVELRGEVWVLSPRCTATHLDAAVRHFENDPHDEDKKAEYENLYRKP
jgi:hypothetical protein